MAKTTKRAFDVCVAGILSIALAPVYVAVAICVALRLGRPVLFTQHRPGLNGRIFRLYKFRTMTDERDERGELLPDSDRLKPFGRWLRASSLDELPSLFNVLRGDMSLVGPRPLLVEYLALYTPQQARRHEVRPGITGWAQVNGRNALTWEQKFEYDVDYVDRQSLALDLRILWLTIFKVLYREGVTEAGHSTMSRFTGSSEQ